MNAVPDSCYRYSYLARLDTGKTADCSILSDRNRESTVSDKTGSTTLLKSLTGVAYMKSICNRLNSKRESSPVSFTAFGFETFYTIAHELAHT